MPQTLGANLTYSANGLWTAKLDRSVVANIHIAAITVKTLAGRADTMRFVFRKSRKAGFGYGYEGKVSWRQRGELQDPL